MEALAQPGSGSSSLLPQGTPRRDAGHVFDKRNNGGVIPLAASSVLYSMESFVDYCSHWQRYFEFASHVHSVTQVFDLRVYFPSRFQIPRQHLGCFDVQRSTTRQASTHGLNEQGRINTSFGAVDQGFTHPRLGVGRGATWLSPHSWCIVLPETWETPLSC